MNDPAPFPAPSLRAEKDARPSLPHLALLYAAYFLAGGLGQGLALIPGVSIIFWPPVGILLATLLLHPRASWPWWILAGGLAELTCNAVWFHSPLHLAAIYFAANALEAAAGAWLIQRECGTQPFRLESLREVAALVLLGAGVAPMLSATIIATTDALIGKHAFAVAWPLVWLGDGAGLLVSTPLTLVTVLAWRERARIAPRRLGEGAALVLVLCGLAAFAFPGHLPSAYMLLPPMLWAAARYRLKGAAAAVGLVTLLVAILTARGEGAFAGPPAELRERVVMLQAFLAISAVSTLLVGVLALERHRAIAALAQANAELETRVAERTATLRAAQQEAEAASRAKDHFLAQLSHELRTPLTPVLMGATALRDDESLPAAAREQLAMIVRNVALEARLIDDLLDLTRIVRGKLPLRSEPCDVHSLLGHVVEIVREEAREKQIGLALEFAAQRHHLTGDPARLQQVFWNLLRNAVKFTPRGGSITLRTRDGTSASTAEQAGGGVFRAEVIDDGIGFDPAAAGRLFRPFEQEAHSLGGLGLGLAIAKALVDRHGGAISASSPGLGGGAVFAVELPGATAPAAGAAREGVAPGGAAQAVAPLRLLLVEDHEATRQVLARLLTQDGHSLATAGSIAEARVAAGRERFDAVVSDLGLPDGTGIELMTHLREAHGLRGIALSGYGMDEDLRRSLDAGFAAHLVKPIEMSELRRALRQIAEPPA